MAAVLVFRPLPSRHAGVSVRPRPQGSQGRGEIVIFPGVRRERHADRPACRASSDRAGEGARDESR